MQGNWKGLTSHGSLGLEIVLGLILPIYLGSLADKHYQTGNTFFFIGVILGIAHGVRAVVRVIRESNRQAEKEEREMKKKRVEYYEKRDK